ncbi:universal stress protein YxiE-like isoform X1 [Biomphalaria glabrata]|uniref:Universal stress protein YxiE-like isoform X1 n=3 Tax=Biomphalaria TaxID=6525 RepID=A0A9W3A7N1_BIOGL|nr:universal stress protein YxiE-like isoform X1 [Biomphalaria glabrata]XP_055883181.1 universal stress protein YxiE-like isoform X1 [Biomphalaria glabrata]KAI8733202.1 universal stress protein YxiE-like [Biomphalaria glabrata]KAK0064163.1 universal stress protein YxiE [Biomphalaria pfeifferi]
MAKNKDHLVVVLAVDQSEHSEFTFKWYINNIHRPDNILHIVHVPEVPGDLSKVMTASVKVQEITEAARHKIDTIKDNYLEWAFQNGIPEAKFANPHGSEPWHEIVTYAEKVGAGLIVIGSRGQGKLKRTILGSVSDSVLHHSDIPVLICRSKDSNSVIVSH